MSRKYKYAVGLSAEDFTSGYVELTPEEAKIVAYATNTANWSDLESNPYSGSFFIDVANPSEFTSDIKSYLLSNKSYKEYEFIDSGMSLKELINEISQTDDDYIIQIRSIQPIKDKKDNIIDIVGFAGVCKFNNGEIISLDGDTYNSEMTVYGYEWFDYDNEEYDSPREMCISNDFILERFCSRFPNKRENN